MRISKLLLYFFPSVVIRSEVILLSICCVSSGASVLLIGDSISQGYAVRSQNIAGARHTITHIGVNGTGSANGVANISSWMDSLPGIWDVVHFNHGLHDISRTPTIASPPATSVQDYQDNLSAIINAIQVHSPNALIVFATSTPIKDQDNRIPSDVVMYNQAAVAVMEEYGVGVNDLYTNVLPRLDELSSDGTHFTPEGNQYNAQAVVDYLDAIPETSFFLQVILGIGMVSFNRRRPG